MGLREQWFHTLVHSSSDIVALTDAEGTLCLINPRLETLLGYRTADVLGRKILDFVHPEDLPQASRKFAQTLHHEGQGAPSVLRLRHSSGSWIPFEITADNQLKNPDVVGVIFTARDVRYREELTEAGDDPARNGQRIAELARRNATLRIENQSRQQTQKEFHQAISLLNAALDATADGLLVVSTEGRVSSCNRKFLDMWGIADGTTVGKRDEDLLAQALPQLRDRAEFLAKVQELYSNPEATSFDTLNLKDGRIFERYSQPQRIGERVVGRVWSFRDVTRSRRLEQELRQSQKMEAVGRLAGGVAHDFNNLLMLMSGYLSQLDSNPTLAPEHRSIVEQLLATTRRGASLTRQLLAFSRKDQTSPAVADLNGVVREMEPLLRRLLSDNIRLELSLSNRALYVLLDITQIELAIMNLCINAQDAMPEGGTLAIRTWNESQPFSESSPGKLETRYAVIQVSDTGHGMAPDTQAHIFEPFFTTKEPGKGTGLGLATVYGIVQRAGGQIKISSQLNQGSSFRMFLPQTVGTPKTDSAVRESGPPPHGHETILLAEDEAGIRSLTRTYLEGLGYQVLEASNGTEAVTLASEYRGAIDLVLTDLMMPGMRGDSMVKVIRQDRPAIKAIFMSGFAEGAAVESSLEVLEKPFVFPILGHRIRALLDREEARISGNIAV